VKEIALDLVLDAVKEGMQCIILENSKENCRDYALNLSNPKNPHSKTLNDLLDVETQKGLNNKSSSIILFSRSKNSRTLANCMLNGIAYYQGDLNEAETHSVATAFNEGLIKVLFATTKLEKRLKENNTKNSNTNYFQKKLTGNNHEYMVKSQQSINIPLAKIIKRESEWYHLNNGDTYVPIYAHKQKIRNENADIPVPYGYSILLSGKNNVFEIIQEKLIYDQSENMTFCLKNEFMLRRHVLGIISSKFAKSYEEVADFFSKTFSAYTGDSIELVQDALTFLIDHDMVILNNEELKATAFGELVSSMYLDPHTAATIAKDLETAHHKDIKITEITLLHLISKTVDVRTVNLKNDIETRNVFYYALQHQHEIIDFPDLATTDEIEKKEFLETLKNTMILDAHINEIDPSTISEKYAIVTGDLPILTLSASWIATAAKNIALIKNMHLGLNNLDTRLKYGVKEQRVPMIEIDGLGLDKTRDLIKAGITSIEILKSSTFEEVEKIIGEKSAIKVFNQLQVSISPNRKYKNLLDFCNN
jgi:helicase